MNATGGGLLADRVTELEMIELRGRVVVLSAIDNLGKGMAGQAIQNMNLVCGLDEDAGLRVPGGNA